MPTNVPPVTWNPATGFTLPTQAAILNGVQQDFNAAFNVTFNWGTTGGSQTNPLPQGALAASESAILGNVYETFQYYTTQVDPAFATGRMQDAIGRIYFLSLIHI